MKILGVSCYYHDSAAALIDDGEISAACAEERLSGQKHDSGFPDLAIDYCLNYAGITAEDLDAVIFYDRPLLKFDRILTELMINAPLNYRQYISALPLWLRQKLWIGQRLRKKLGDSPEYYFAEHHLSHAAGAFFLSPFDDAAIVTIDGVGEHTTASIAEGNGNRITLHREMNYPHSVGLLYSAFTYFLGFRVNSGEYKLMGLAPYGSPRFAGIIADKLVTVHNDGSLNLNLKYFTFQHGLAMTGQRFEELLGTPRRLPDDPLEDIHRDLAASVQKVTEDIMIAMTDYARELTGKSKLVMSGGVALNSKAAGLLLAGGKWDDIFIQPTSGDDGGALGATLFLYHHLLGNERQKHRTISALGPAVAMDELKRLCENHGIPHKAVDTTAEIVAMALHNGKIVGLITGRSEYGPRALGHRSILASARDAATKDKINSTIKFRESFRPFAPIVLEEKAGEWFDVDRPSPYMTFVVPVRPEKREMIPAVTHIDGTARIQTVNRDQNQTACDILEHYEQLTGIPVLLNTSYNLRGFPIAATAKQVLQVFFSSGIDMLCIENLIFDKSDIPRPYPDELVISPGID